ncbi:MAG: pilus assembly protein PilP [Bacillota bacterium]
MKSVRWMISYILVASLGLWLAFAVSMRFMAPAHSQGAPSNGDLPPEFMKEVENTQAPPKATPAATPQAVHPAVNPQAVPPSIPPPPQEGVPTPPGQPAMGDAVTASAVSKQDLIPRDDYIYDPTGKRDPFKPFRAIHMTTARKGTPKDQLEPLQRWELDRLQIVGILWDVGTPRAMIKDPDGGVYTVTKNSKIGRNEGYVSAIREGEIVIVEVRYEDDKPIKETRVMELKK